MTAVIGPAIYYDPNEGTSFDDGPTFFEGDTDGSVSVITDPEKITELEEELERNSSNNYTYVMIGIGIGAIIIGLMLVTGFSIGSGK